VRRAPARSRRSRRRSMPTHRAPSDAAKVKMLAGAVRDLAK
jgi:hypothetical protein